MHWFASACGGHKGSRACTHTCTAHRFMVGTVQCSTLPVLVVECLHPFPLVSTTFRVHFRGTAVLPDVLPSTFVCACLLPVCSGCKGYGSGLVFTCTALHYLWGAVQCSTTSSYIGCLVLASPIVSTTSPRALEPHLPLYSPRSLNKLPRDPPSTATPPPL